MCNTCPTKLQGPLAEVTKGPHPSHHEVELLSSAALQEAMSAHAYRPRKQPAGPAHEAACMAACVQQHPHRCHMHTAANKAHAVPASILCLGQPLQYTCAWRLKLDAVQVQMQVPMQPCSMHMHVAKP